MPSAPAGVPKQLDPRSLSFLLRAWFHIVKSTHPSVCLQQRVSADAPAVEVCRWKCIEVLATLTQRDSADCTSAKHFPSSDLIWISQQVHVSLPLTQRQYINVHSKSVLMHPILQREKPCVAVAKWQKAGGQLSHGTETPISLADSNLMSFGLQQLS